MNEDGKRGSPRALWLAIALVCLGAILRLWNLRVMEFKADEQEALNLGISLLRDRPWATAASWPATGMLGSNGVANAPLFNSIMALFWGVTGSPVGATALVAVLNSLSLFPLFVWARRRFGNANGLLILAFCAVSPFAVIYSRKLWAQDLLFLGLVCLLWGLEWVGSARFWRGVVLLGLAALLVGQLHQSGPIALAVLPVAWLCQFFVDRRQGRSRFKVDWPTPVQAVGVAAVTAANLFYWIPYLAYLHHLPKTVLDARPTLPTFAPQLGVRLLAQVVPLDLFHFFLPRQGDFLKETVPVVSFILRHVGYYGSLVLGVPLAAYGVARWLIRPQSIPVLGFWWLGTIAAFTLARIPCYPHYTLILVPLPAVLVAGVFDIDRPLPAKVLPWVTGLRVAYLAALACLSIGFLTWIGARGGAQGDYGVSYRVREAQARALLDHIDRRPWSRRDPTELDFGERQTLNCHSVPAEVRWLVLWKRPELDHIPAGIRICDAWLDAKTHHMYRWAVYEIPRPAPRGPKPPDSSSIAP